MDNPKKEPKHVLTKVNKSQYDLVPIMTGTLPVKLIFKKVVYGRHATWETRRFLDFSWSLLWHTSQLSPCNALSFLPAACRVFPRLRFSSYLHMEISPFSLSLSQQRGNLRPFLRRGPLHPKKKDVTKGALDVVFAELLADPSFRTRQRCADHDDRNTAVSRVSSEWPFFEYSNIPYSFRFIFEYWIYSNIGHFPLFYNMKKPPGIHQ